MGKVVRFIPIPKEVPGIPMDIVAVPITDESGQVVAAFCVAYDQTNQQRLDHIMTESDEGFRKTSRNGTAGCRTFRGTTSDK
ncbi:hypothetical protein BSAF29S_03007 [Bacillus safensis subsp. safensis]